jgi:hypothetical protein
MQIKIFYFHKDYQEEVDIFRRLYVQLRHTLYKYSYRQSIIHTFR